MADAAQATLWSFPGVAKAAPALLQIEACAKDYHLTGASPPSPTDRDAWEPLLRLEFRVRVGVRVRVRVGEPLIRRACTHTRPAPDDDIPTRTRTCSVAPLTLTLT